MANNTYKDDRSYTDKIHSDIALETIYPLMGWVPYTLDAELEQIKDSDYSIDYHATDQSGIKIVIQERFRRPNTPFDDFTLRYERSDNSEEIEQKSEFFKIKGKINRSTWRIASF